MPSSLDVVGQFVAGRVRDAAIAEANLLFSSDAAPTIQSNRQRIVGELNAAELDAIARAIPTIVDATLDRLLGQFEQQTAVALCCRADDGSLEDVAEQSDGLAGELYGPNGWIQGFSARPPTE